MRREEFVPIRGIASFGEEREESTLPSFLFSLNHDGVSVYWFVEHGAIPDTLPHWTPSFTCGLFLGKAGCAGFGDNLDDAVDYFLRLEFVHGARKGQVPNLLVYLRWSLGNLEIVLFRSCRNGALLKRLVSPFPEGKHLTNLYSNIGLLFPWGIDHRRCVRSWLLPSEPPWRKMPIYWQYRTEKSPFDPVLSGSWS